VCENDIGIFTWLISMGLGAIAVSEELEDQKVGICFQLVWRGVVEVCKEVSAYIAKK
jgi:hypothetical protein